MCKKKKKNRKPRNAISNLYFIHIHILFNLHWIRIHCSNSAWKLTGIDDYRSKMNSSPSRRSGGHSVVTAVAALIAAVSVLQSRPAGAYESGAPVLTCRTMVPGHGKSAQTTPPPYRLVPSMSPNSSQVRVTLTAPGPNDYFVGFLIEARTPDGKSDAIGSFVQVPQDSLTLDCNEEPVSVPLAKLIWSAGRGWESSKKFRKPPFRRFLNAKAVLSGDFLAD